MHKLIIKLNTCRSIVRLFEKCTPNRGTRWVDRASNRRTTSIRHCLVPNGGNASTKLIVLIKRPCVDAITPHRLMSFQKNGLITQLATDADLRKKNSNPDVDARHDVRRKNIPRPIPMLTKEQISGEHGRLQKVLEKYRARRYA